jgi:putative selenium metabolism hydrolase
LGFDDVSVDEYGTVTGVVEGDQAGPTIVMDAHTDTVGIAPTTRWTYDPYGGEIIEGRLYGRGSSDMKGSLAAMMLSAVSINRNEAVGRVVVSASVMEEVLEGAALEMVIDHYKPDYVIIGEASDMKIVHAGRGRAEIQVETIGRPAHTSAPHQGINAVEAMIPAIQAIQNLQLPTDPFIGQAVVALSEIISEPYPTQSVIPYRCLAKFDRRLMPGEKYQDVLNEFQNLPTIPGASLNAAITIGEYKSCTDRIVRREKWFPAWQLDREHNLVQAAVRALSSLGLPVDYGAYNFCTNAAYSIGVAKVPTIGFGPSPESLAHIADEYVNVDDLISTATVYREILRELLVASNPG